MRLTRKIACPLFALLLAACSAEPPVTSKEPSLVQLQHVHEVGFEPGSRAVSPHEKQVLSAFYDRISPRGIGRAVVGASDSDGLSAARVRSVSHFLAQKGIKPQIARPGMLPQADGVTVILTTTRLVQAECPDWSSDADQNWENQDFSNFGCAYHNNIAVQLVQPSDYYGGRGTTSMHPMRDAEIIKKYITNSAMGPSGAGGSSASSSGTSSSTQ